MAKDQSGKQSFGPKTPRSVIKGTGQFGGKGTNQVQGGGKLMGNRGQHSSTASRGPAKGIKRGK